VSIMVKRLGYGGAAVIDGSQVLITSGSFSIGKTIPYLNMINTPPNNTFAGKVKHMDGVTGYTGTLSFDLDEDSIGLFTKSKLLARHYKFNVGIHDGVGQQVMTDCFASSVSISGAVGGLVNGTVSFMSKTAPVAATVARSFIRGNVPLGYWLTGDGTNNIKDWSLTMNQDLSMEYLNEDSMEAGYIKVGLVSYSLNITSYEEMTDGEQATIYVPNGIVLHGDTVGKGFAYGGLTDLGSYSYEFETSSRNGKSDSLVIE
jgi:hypothetical protein